MKTSNFTTALIESPSITEPVPPVRRLLKEEEDDAAETFEHLLPMQSRSSAECVAQRHEETPADTHTHRGISLDINIQSIVAGVRRASPAAAAQNQSWLPIPHPFSYPACHQASNSRQRLGSFTIEPVIDSLLLANLIRYIYIYIYIG